MRDTGPTPVGAPRARLRAVALLAGGLALALLLGELALRWVLAPGAHERPGWRLRRAGLYADAQSDDDYWKLEHRFRPAGERDSFVHRDARLGWLDPRLEPDTYAHADEGGLRGRRPVLLYGDSFAACTTAPADCWEGLLERDPELGATHALLNHGTAAFGLDQTLLLLRASLPRWRGRQPRVVVGIFVEDALDRSLLAFRGCPKPRFELDAAGRLILHPAPELSIEQYLALHPPRIPSYLARALLHGFPALARRLPPWLAKPRDEHPALVARKQRLGRALLLELRELLQGEGVDSFVILFQGERSLREGDRWAWKDRFLARTLHELGIPFVRAAPHLLADQRASGRGDREHFERQHYTAAGNAAVYPALARGLRGEYDAPE